MSHGTLVQCILQLPKLDSNQWTVTENRCLNALIGRNSGFIATSLIKSLVRLRASGSHKAVEIAKPYGLHLVTGTCTCGENILWSDKLEKRARVESVFWEELVFDGEVRSEDLRQRNATVLTREPHVCRMRHPARYRVLPFNAPVYP